MPILRQIAAVMAINLKSIPQRLWMSLSSVIASAIVVLVLLGFLAMANGFRETVAGTGADDVAVIMRPASQSELNSIVSREQVNIIRDGAPGIVRTSGVPALSPEVYVIVDGIKKSTGLSVNLPMRGLEHEAGLRVRDTVRLAAGRWFEPGRNELVAGRGTVAEFGGFDLGDTVTFGADRWTVVGHFEAGGSVFESELWADIRVVQDLFNRGSSSQIVRARLESAEALAPLSDFLEADARLKLEAKSERRYLAGQSQATASLIEGIGWPIAITMALGALAGALNTMYASVAARTREIGTLRAIGFGGIATFTGTLAESLALSALGGVLGAALAWAGFRNLTASTLNFGGSFTQVVFDFSLDAGLVAQGIVLAMLVGLVGGIFPAFRAARIPVAVAFGDR